MLHVAAAALGLKLWPQPADEAAFLFGRPLVVEGYEPLQDFVVGERDRPAVGVEHGHVEVVVDLSEHADEAIVVDFLVLGREGFARTQLFEDVVHPRDRQPRMRRLLLLAVGVEGLAEFADCLLLGLGRGGKWEWQKTGTVLV